MKRKISVVAAAMSAILIFALWLPAGAQAHPASTRSTTECALSPSTAGNVTLDCPDEYSQPTREPTIAVDPTDPRHMIVAAVDGLIPDWQEFPVPDSHQSIEFSTTFDAGATWTIGDVPPAPNADNWDPWLAFDRKHGVVIMAFETTFPQNAKGCRPSNQMATMSTDGGLHWGRPVIALAGQACGQRHVEQFEEGKIGTDNDPASPYYGRTYLTGLLIAPGCDVGTCTLPTVESHSDNGGITWTRPKVISGSNPEYCTGPPGAPACDWDPPPAAPFVGRDGSVHVAFLNEQHDVAWEPGECCDDQIMVVSSTNGGATWAPPVRVVDLENGADFETFLYGDYECSPDLFFGCRLTGTDLPPFPPGGYLAAGPDGTLYMVFADNRDGRHDVEHPVSNVDVFLMTSTNSGQTWTGPDVVSDAPGDQFKPSIAMNPVTGELGILFYDRGDDPDGQTMEVTLASGLPGSFQLNTVSTAPSHLSDDLWFTQTLPDCFHCVFHIGEYLGLAYGSDGAANMVWSDLRRYVTLPDGRQGYSTNVMYARQDFALATP
jgi:hypothetical protein